LEGNLEIVDLRSLAAFAVATTTSFSFARPSSNESIEFGFHVLCATNLTTTNGLRLEFAATFALPIVPSFTPIFHALQLAALCL